MTSTSGICRNFYLRTPSPTTNTSKRRLDNTTAVFYGFLRVARIFNLPSRTRIAPETCIIDKCASPALDTNAPGARARLCQYETHNTRPSPALPDNTTSSNAQHLSRLFQSTSERQPKVLVVPVIFICFRSWLFLLLIVYKGPRS